VAGCSHKGGPIIDYAPPPHGLFQYYGFDQSDSEKFIPILHLIHTGAYKVEEYNRWDRNGNRIMEFTFEIFVKADSITIDETDWSPDGQTKYFTGRSVYLKNGKLGYEKEIRGSMESEKYTINDRTGLLLKNIKKNFGKITDSTVTSYQYDSSGNLIQENNYNFYGYLSSKKIYKYDSLGKLSKTVDSVQKY